jgi:futalosine hydrolase
VDLEGADRLREVTSGRRIVLLTATETEAEPLRVGLLGVERFVVATKTLCLGDLRVTRPGAAGTGRGCSSGATGPTIPTVLAIGGCDKANTAHILTCLLQAMRPAPALVLQAGIGGAFRGAEPARGPGRAGAHPEIGDIVLATQEAYSDTGSSSPGGWLSPADLGLPIACVDGAETGGVFPLGLDLVDAAREAIAAVDWPEAPPAIHTGPCVTSSRTTGRQVDAEAAYERWSALAESMEGAAAAHICALYEVPFLEVRGISNFVGDRERAGWEVERAVAVAGRAALAVAAVLPDLPLPAVKGPGSRPGRG